MKYILLLSVIFGISGCSHIQWVKNTYDPVTNKCTEHEIISSTQVMYFSDRKDVSAEYNKMKLTVGSTTQNPEFPPGFLDLFYDYLVKEKNTMFITGELE